MSKNLFKRLLAVVASTAICSAMAATMTASAVESETDGSCVHEIMLEGRLTEQSSYTHEYTYEVTVGDSVIPVTESCDVDVKTVYCTMNCYGCDYYYIIPNSEIVKVETHSRAGETIHDMLFGSSNE